VHVGFSPQRIAAGHRKSLHWQERFGGLLREPQR